MCEMSSSPPPPHTYTSSSSGELLFSFGCVSNYIRERTYTRNPLTQGGTFRQTLTHTHHTHTHTHTLTTSDPFGVELIPWRHCGRLCCICYPLFGCGPCRFGWGGATDSVGVSSCLGRLCAENGKRSRTKHSRTVYYSPSNPTRVSSGRR